MYATIYTKIYIHNQNNTPLFHYIQMKWLYSCAGTS